MANSRPAKRTFTAADLGLSPSNATTGVWASQLASNVYTLHKAAAATVSVLNLPVPKSQADPGTEDALIQSISVQYQVGTAALSGAPTAALNKLTFNDDGTVTRTAIATDALTFSGTNTVGTAVGSYWVKVNITAPAKLADNESLVLALTMNEAATSVLDLNAIKVDYKG